MAYRSLWDSADALTDACLRGYADTWPHLITLQPDGMLVRSQPKPDDRVALVIGNGLGHEPAMAGLVGEGLFDINVTGRLFEAPPGTRLRKGLEAADRSSGVLLLVSNHSGDVLNAEMALERHDPQSGPVEMVVVGDDVASAPATEHRSRRGTAGLWFVWKIVGAAAEAGHSLPECVSLAREVADCLRSIGAAMAPGSHPITGEHVVDVPDAAVVIGTGVHGETAGGTLESPDATALIQAMLEPLIAEVPVGPVAVMCNNTGGLAPTVQAALMAESIRQLTASGYDVTRGWFGHYATTFDLTGMGLSLLSVDERLTALYDAPCQAPALSSQGRGPVG